MIFLCTSQRGSVLVSPRLAVIRAMLTRWFEIVSTSVLLVRNPWSFDLLLHSQILLLLFLVCGIALCVAQRQQLTLQTWRGSLGVSLQSSVSMNSDSRQWLMGEGNQTGKQFIFLPSPNH